MAKLTLNDVGSILTASNTLNTNNQRIEDALEKTLSRDGTEPNEMNADLDMNSQRIYNLPEPTTDTEPARKKDFDDIVAAAVNGVVATKAEAEAGSNNIKTMTPLRSKQQIEGGSFRIGAGVWPPQYKFGGNSPSSPVAFQIGGGFTAEGTEGVTLGNDGHSSWLRFQPSRDESAVEVVVYPTGGQGRATGTIGTSTITRVVGTTFKASWVGRKVYFNEQYYIIATVPDGNTMTVTSGSGTVPFSATVTDTFHVVVIRGEGVCNVSGSTVTRVSGDPFVAFITGPFKFWINGVLRTVSGFTDVNTYTLSAPPGDATNGTFVFESDINDQITTFRLQKMLGSDEENLSIYARYDGYWIHSLFAGNGSYRKIVLGAGEMSPGNLARQVVLQKDGNLSLGGDYNYEAIRVLNPTGISPVNRLETQGAPTGVSPNWRARGADTNVGLGFDTKGTGSVTFTSHSFGFNEFTIEGAGAASWLAVGSHATQPYLAARGATNASIWLIPNGSGTIITPIGNIQEFADDAAASAGGIVIGGFYRTASALKIRVA